MKYIFGITITALIFFFLIALPWVVIDGWHVETGKGEHTGYVTAVERSGLIWKTGTAYIKTDISSSQEDIYCITDSAVYQELEIASKNQQKVTIKYLSYLASGIRHCNAEPAIIYGTK